MTRENLLGLPWSSALQHKIHVQQESAQYSGTGFIVHQLQTLQGEYPNEIIESVSDFSSRDKSPQLAMAVFLLVFNSMSASVSQIVQH